MTLQISDVNRLAQLAQLKITSEQATDVLQKLNGIFGLVEQMTAVDTRGVEPLSHPIALVQPQLALNPRADQIREINQRDACQQVAPAVQDGLYLVPKVIE